VTDKQRQKIIDRCNAALEKDPNCVWAKNELRYLDVRKMPPPICEAAMAYMADYEYHGGYVE
jgi:hypothetical protein